ncbi:MAG TPA: ArgE/DapE family deacylase [Micromonosporaceae bacterium]|nr:ArgE/DapE family deacylase [Micromonosporaceae bacterium]
MTLTPAEQRVADAVNADSIVADLAALVAIPSVGGSAAEVQVQRWFAGTLAELGAKVDHWSIDLVEARSAPAYPGEEVGRDEAYGCVGVIGGGPTAAEPALILNGHTDVVPPGLAAWAHEPWRLSVINDRLHGRGASDMKGGLAAVLGAVRALRTSGIQMRRPLAVHAVIGEEDGGLGTFATLRRGHGGDCCVIAEPTDGSVVPANAGSLTFRLDVPGRAAHGSSRLDGYSAIDGFVPLLAALRRLEARRNRDIHPLLAHLALPYPISVGIVRAGDWASTVPDHLTAEGRYGVRLDEPVEAAKAELEAAVALACADDPWLSDHPAALSWSGGEFASGRLPDGHPLVDDVCAAVEDALGWRPAVRGAPYGSDLRQYAAAGIPTVQAGPGSVASAHAVDESTSLTELVAFARSYAVLALRLCG